MMPPKAKAQKAIKVTCIMFAMPPRVSRVSTNSLPVTEV